MPLHLEIERIFHDLFDLGNDRIKPLDMPDTNRYSFRSSFHEPLCFLRCRTDWFFYEYRFLFREYLADYLRVELGRDDDADSIRVIEKLTDRPKTVAPYLSPRAFAASAFTS